MNPKKLKIAVFIASFILFIVFLFFVDISKKLNYYNIDNSYNDSLIVQIKFKNSLDRKEIQLYYSASVNAKSHYTNDQRTKVFVNNQTADFKFFTKYIPILLRVSFDKNIKDTISIKQVSINLIDQNIDIDLTKFLAHPSIQVLKKKSDFIKIDLTPKNGIKYDPYIYLENPVYINKITTTEIILILIIISLLSFLISQLSVYLLNYKTSPESINSILLFLLIISLLFKEHWISKSTILIGLYTLFLFIKKKTKLKDINYYGFSLFFIFAVISLTWSTNIDNSLPKIIGFLPFIILPIWAKFLNSKIRYDIIFKYVGIIFMLISIATILLASFRFNSSHQMSEFYYHTLASPLSTNAIYISLLYLIIFLFDLFFLLRKKEKIEVFDFFTLTILFIYILLLSSKLIIILLIFSTCIVLYPSLKLRFKNRKLIRAGIVIISSIFLVIFLSHNNLSKRFDKVLNIEKIKEVYSLNEFGDTYMWNGLNLRLLQLRAFYDIETNDHFNSLIGVGLNNGQVLLNERYKYYKLDTGKKWEKNGGYLSYNFHNQYAQILIELGFIGFLLLIYLFYRLIVNAINSRNFLLFSIVFIFILIMFTESILVRQKGIMFFVLFPLIAIEVKKYIEQKELI